MCFVGLSLQSSLAGYLLCACPAVRLLVHCRCLRFSCLSVLCLLDRSHPVLLPTVLFNHLCLPLQGTLPAGIDQRYLSGFLAREVDRAAERARDATSGRAAAPPGAALLQAVLVRYGQLLGVGHLALAGHRLAELQREGLAGAQQVRLQEQLVS